MSAKTIQTKINLWCTHESIGWIIFLSRWSQCSCLSSWYGLNMLPYPDWGLVLYALWWSGSLFAAINVYGAWLRPFVGLRAHICPHLPAHLHFWPITISIIWNEWKYLGTTAKQGWALCKQKVWPVHCSELLLKAWTKTFLMLIWRLMFLNLDMKILIVNV